MSKDLNTTIEIIEAGLQTTIQDFGRFAYRSFGISQSGAIDKRLLLIANNLLQQNPSTPGLEFALTGPKIKILNGSVKAALVANCQAELVSDSKASIISPFQSFKLTQNDLLSIRPLKLTSYGYLCFAGQLDIQKVLGSYSTDLTAEFGGFNGRALMTGDIININNFKTNKTISKIINPKITLASETIRVIKEDEANLFSDSITASNNYTISLNKNRMGVRLIGSPLKPKDRNISLISEAQSVGTVQITGDNMPIVLLNDCQTIGGYPKVASVIRADIPKLSQLQSNAKVDFVEVSKTQASLAYQQMQKQINTIKNNIIYEHE